MINKKSTLITGGDGLLGREIVTLLPNSLHPDIKSLNIRNRRILEKYLTDNKIKLIIHLAAYMPPPLANKNPLEAIETNIIGTSYIVDLCIRHSIKLVYLSTDYVFNGDSGMYREVDPVLPVNKYAWSKLGGECAVRLLDNSIIIRTSFEPKIFPYDKAFVDQWTTKERVDIIARKIVRLIETNATGVYHIGGKRLSRYELALELSSGRNIGKLRRNELSYKTPKDVSLNSDKYNKIIRDFYKKG